MSKSFFIACLVAAGIALHAQTTPIALPKVAPTVDQVLSLKRAGSPQISPDGRFVAYTVRETNWDDNAYETEIWLANAQTGGTRPPTHAKKSSQPPASSPPGSKLPFVSAPTHKPQIYLINPQGAQPQTPTTPQDRGGDFPGAPHRQR